MRNLALQRSPHIERLTFIKTVEKAVADINLPSDVEKELWQVLATKGGAWVRHSYLAATNNAEYERREKI